MNASIIIAGGPRSEHGIVPNMSRLHAKRFVLFATLIILFTSATPYTGVVMYAADEGGKTRAEVPPGFERYLVAGRTFISRPPDNLWISLSVEAIKKKTATTQPADILAKLSADMPRLTTDILAIWPAISVAETKLFLSDLLPNDINVIADKPLRVVHMVAAAEHVKQAAKDGWRTRNIRYNKAGDVLELSAYVETDGTESIVPALFDPQLSEATRIQLLTKYLEMSDTDMALAQLRRSVTAGLSGFQTFFATQALADVAQADDQIWFVQGVSTALAARYMSDLSGIQAEQIVSAITRQPSVKSRAGDFDDRLVDLLDPLQTAQLKPERLSAYTNARRRKATRVIHQWLGQIAPSALPRVVQAIRKSRPADGATLVAIIQAETGIDLTPQLRK